MPLFDYACASCGRRTEVFTRSAPAPAVRCEHCGSEDTTRAISTFAIRVPGAAMYSEEFREKTLPFLKSRPGADAVFGGGGESDEAKAHRLTQEIGKRIDRAMGAGPEA